MVVSITPLLKRLAAYQDDGQGHVSDELVQDIQAAFAAILASGEVSDIQRTALFTALTFSNLYHHSAVVGAIVHVMRQAAVKLPIDFDHPEFALKRQALVSNNYHGGFIDIVGTGGDGHNTFNVSTTAALLASPYVLIAKHGNRAATSLSGSSDLISALAHPVNVLDVKPESVGPILANHSNLAFLFAPTYHKSLGPIAPIRKEIGFSTIFNVLGPLANPIEGIEARILGVKNRALGHVFSKVLQVMGCHKAMVVCGDVGAGLDEISPAGRTFCWRLVAPPPGSPAGTLASISEMELHPTTDFGLEVHDLQDCKSLSPGQNAEIVHKILRNEMSIGHPILDYCVMNAAALLVIAGVTNEWREGVQLIMNGLEKKAALKEWEGYVEGCRILS